MIFFYRDNSLLEDFMISVICPWVVSSPFIFILSGFSYIYLFISLLLMLHIHSLYLFDVRSVSFGNNLFYIHYPLWTHRVKYTDISNIKILIKKKGDKTKIDPLDFINSIKSNRFWFEEVQTFKATLDTPGAALIKLKNGQCIRLTKFGKNLKEMALLLEKKLASKYTSQKKHEEYVSPNNQEKISVILLSYIWVAVFFIELSVFGVFYTLAFCNFVLSAGISMNYIILSSFIPTILITPVALFFAKRIAYRKKKIVTITSITIYFLLISLFAFFFAYS